MAGKRLRSNGTWEYIFKRQGVLPKPVYFTFDSEEEGDRYAERAEALLEKGVIPQEMLEGSAKTLAGLIDMYGSTVSMRRSEAQLLPVLRSLVGTTKTEVLCYNWVEDLVRQMHEKDLASSTITKRVSGLARVVDWGMRKNYLSLASNPFRLLPKGYGSKAFDKNKLWDGERSRRLEDGEEEKIRPVLNHEEGLMFTVALETAMRLSEIFTMRSENVDFEKDTIFVPRSKNGARRQVPMSSVVRRVLEAEKLGEREWVFENYWQGGDEDLREKVGNSLSRLFSRRFKKAGLVDLHFHDLRHEATSRLYERTTMSDLEIASITGHKGFRMLQRYANLRGSNLSKKMW